MRKTKRNDEIYPDPYEDMLRLEKLDPYESIIKLNQRVKRKNEHIE